MPIPPSFTFYRENGQFLEWTLADGILASSINTATVTATLYLGRDRFHPDVTPGTPVTGFNAIALAFVANGLYRGVIGAAFAPVAGLSYVLVVDATANGFAAQHWEVPAVVETRAA
jgi:hypothetical protein